MGTQGLLLLLGLKVLNMITYVYITAKYCYFRCSRPPNMDEIKRFVKDDKVINTSRQKEQCFAAWSKNLTPSTSGGLKQLK